MLARVLAARRWARAKDVLDVFTGSGALALAAARDGARTVTAVDVSRRALLSVWLNARRAGFRVAIRRGDVLAPVAGESFDLILANPPYLPGDKTLPTRGVARAWEGGVDGRVLVDRLLDDVSEHLRPGGRLLMVQSSLTGEAQTVERMRAAGLRPEVLARHRGPLGAVGRTRVEMLRDRGLLVAGDGDDHEEILVISGLASPGSR